MQCLGRAHRTQHLLEVAEDGLKLGAVRRREGVNRPVADAVTPRGVLVEQSVDLAQMVCPSDHRTRGRPPDDPVSCGHRAPSSSTNSQVKRHERGFFGAVVPDNETPRRALIPNRDRSPRLRWRRSQNTFARTDKIGDHRARAHHLILRSRTAWPQDAGPLWPLLAQTTSSRISLRLVSPGGRAERVMDTGRSADRKVSPHGYGLPGPTVGRRCTRRPLRV
jgi:hypothetical protein